MRRLDRYIIASVTRALLLTLLLLLSLACLIEWLDQRSATTGLDEALRFALLTLPRRAHELLPFVGLLGVLAGLGALAGTHELTAARAAGLGVPHIVAVALAPVFVMVLVSSAVTEWLMPVAEASIAMQRAQKRLDREASTVTLRWVRLVDQGHEEFIAVRAFDEHGGMYGVTGFRFAGGALVGVWQSPEIAPAPGAMRGRVRRDLTETLFADDAAVAGLPDTADRADASRHFSTAQSIRARSVWRMPLSPADFEQREVRDAERMPLGRLRALVWGHAEIDQSDPSAAERSRAEPGASAALAAAPLRRLFAAVFWQRIAQPVETLLLAALGTGFVFGSARVASTGTRLAAGVLVAIGFKYVGDLLTLLLLLFAWPAWWTALAPVLLLTGLAWVALVRGR